MDYHREVVHSLVVVDIETRGRVCVRRLCDVAFETSAEPPMEGSMIVLLHRLRHLRLPSLLYLKEDSDCTFVFSMFMISVSAVSGHSLLCVVNHLPGCDMSS